MGLLIQEPPLQILPSLANAIGLNEAIVLQQIHYWIQKSSNVEDGHKWVYNTMDNWQKQFPFWSIATVKRIFRSLEKSGLLISSNYNKARFDRTKWYRIDYQKLEQVNKRMEQCDSESGSNCNNGKDQRDQFALDQPDPIKLDQTDTITLDQSDTTYTKRIPENTSENTTRDILSGKPDHTPYQEILDYLNSKAGTRYRASSKATQRLVRSRMKEHFTVDDFKKVIDIKVAAWKDDPKMCQYLRPATLFGTKFESYLNEPMPIRQPTNPYDRYYE